VPGMPAAVLIIRIQNIDRKCDKKIFKFKISFYLVEKERIQGGQNVKK